MASLRKTWPLFAELIEPMTTTFEPADKDFGQMMQLLTGYWVTQTLGAVANYSIADHLAKGPATAEEIATVEGIDSIATFHLLRSGGRVIVVEWLLAPRKYILKAQSRGARSPAACTIRLQARKASRLCHQLSRFPFR
jgi:hypothetical protein